MSNGIEAYLNQLSDERKNILLKLREMIKNKLPEGFVVTISNGMISYVVPHSIYPEGYHSNPKEPVPFISIASQKNHIALYHMGLLMFPDILNWFRENYPKHVNTKLDMGKSCVRFKNINNIPYNLIGELCSKISLENYIDKYVSVINKR